MHRAHHWFPSRTTSRVRRQSFLSFFGLGGGDESTEGTSTTEEATPPTTLAEDNDEPNELRAKRSTLAEAAEAEGEMANTVEDSPGLGFGSTAELAAHSTAVEVGSPRCAL